MDYTVHGILQARILEWVAFPFSRCSSQHHIAGGFFTSWATKEDQEYGVGSLFLLQQIFLTQESKQGLLHCRRILYQLSYQETPPPPRLQLVCKLVPKHRGEGETKERGRPLQVGSGSFNKQGNLCMRLDLCDHKTCRSLHPPTRILKAYIETLAGFSHTFSQMVSTTNLNKSLKDTAPCVGLLGRRFTPRARSGYIPRARAGVGVRSLYLPGLNSKANQQSHPLDALLQHFVYELCGTFILKSSRTLWGSWAQKPVSPTSCWQDIGFIQPPRHSLSSNRAGWNSC